MRYRRRSRGLEADPIKGDAGTLAAAVRLEPLARRKGKGSAKAVKL
jgi:hypothetical protein